MSVYSRLQGALATAVAALDLQIGGRDVAVRKAKLPVQREAIDTLPAALVVIGDGPESSEPFETNGTQLVGYMIQVVLVAAGSRQPLEGQDSLLDAREAVRKLLQRPGTVGATVPELLRLDCLPQAPVGRAAWLKMFEASSLAVRFECVEPAG